MNTTIEEYRQHLRSLLLSYQTQITEHEKAIDGLVTEQRLVNARLEASDETERLLTTSDKGPSPAVAQTPKGKHGSSRTTAAGDTAPDPRALKSADPESQARALRAAVTGRALFGLPEQDAFVAPEIIEQAIEDGWLRRAPASGIGKTGKHLFLTETLRDAAK